VIYIKNFKNHHGNSTSSYVIEFESHEDADNSRIKILESIRSGKEDILELNWYRKSTTSFRTLESRNETLKQENNNLRALLYHNIESDEDNIKIDKLVDVAIKCSNYDKKVAAKLLNISVASLMKIVNDLNRNKEMNLPVSFGLDLSYIESNLTNLPPREKKSIKNED